MFTDMRERARSESGFTLIELLVVMIIIAILMAVAVPTFLSQKNNAQKSKATANIKQIVNTVEACAVNNTDGTYTGCTTASALVAVEKGLKNLTLVDAPATTVNSYAIQPIGNQGFIVQTSIKDGDATITFAEVHQEDGNLYKLCTGNIGSTASTFATTASSGEGVPGSRTCTNGKWG